MGGYAKPLGRAAREQMAQSKISVRLVELAQPMIDRAVEETGTEPTQKQLHSVLLIAATIWNAQVMARVGGNSRHAEEAHRLFHKLSVPPDMRGLVDEMLERKAREFPDDLRLIGDFEVYRDGDGELQVRAEARLAAELMDEP